MQKYSWVQGVAGGGSGAGTPGGEVQWAAQFLF